MLCNCKFDITLYLLFSILYSKKVWICIWIELEIPAGYPMISNMVKVALPAVSRQQHTLALNILLNMFRVNILVSVDIRAQLLNVVVFSPELFLAYCVQCLCTLLKLRPTSQKTPNAEQLLRAVRGMNPNKLVFTWTLILD